jgi:catechol 2,3-dioxygenase-like lactoylglutathione lyase family enzyme
MPENEVIPALSGVLETSLYVDDVGRSSEFYRSLFGFEVLIQDHRFCALSVAGKQVLLLFEKGSSTSVTVVPGGDIPPHDGAGQLHLAFSIPAAALSGWEARLAERNVAIESRVSWPRGGQSVYFRDPDRNLVELITPGCWSIY